MTLDLFLSDADETLIKYITFFVTLKPLVHYLFAIG